MTPDWVLHMKYDVQKYNIILYTIIYIIQIDYLTTCKHILWIIDWIYVSEQHITCFKVALFWHSSLPLYLYLVETSPKPSQRVLKSSN